MTKDLPYDFTFDDAERAWLVEHLLGLPPSPYADYPRFMDAVRDLAEHPALPARFRDLCERAAARDLAAAPILRLGRAPIDPVLPVFDPDDPVGSKYERKRTFVAEGFLALLAVLGGSEIIAHQSVNAGDFFHDIYPKASMYATQSQKTLETLRFHRDFTNHLVSPDFVVTLTLRNAPNVCSTFVENRAAIAALPADVARALREPVFATPIDDVSTRETGLEFAPPADHPAVSGDAEIKVFEGRTTGRTPAAQRALDVLIATLHACKVSSVAEPGDCVSFANMYVVHGRELAGPTDPVALRQRWLMKTHNVSSLARFASTFVPGRYGVVNG